MTCPVSCFLLGTCFAIRICKEVVESELQKGSGGLSSFAAPPARQDGNTPGGSRRIEK
jgi:hypothetical protein